MSVAAALPTRLKRSFEEESSRGSQSQSLTLAKRVRLHCSPSATGTLQQRLRSIFPEMDESTVISVLSDCGDNIDAAIKRLGQLRLSTAQIQDREVHAGEDSVPSASTSPAPQTAEEWIESLVQEMAAAKDMQDARQRAGRILTLFSSKIQASGDVQEKNALLSKLQELQKENHILKRAVQIQNSKLQERANMDQEVDQLKQVLGQYQEQIRTLEMNNYSLALHLQQATSDPSATRGHRPPDVF